MKEYLSYNRTFKNANLDAAKNPIKLQGRYKGIIKEEALDFLKGLLEMSPTARLTAADALMHPYFKKNREKDPELLNAERSISKAMTLGRLNEVDPETPFKRHSDTMDDLGSSRDKTDPLAASAQQRGLNGTMSLSRNPKGIKVGSMIEGSLDKRSAASYTKLTKLPGMSSEENLSLTLTKQSMPKTYYNVYDSKDSEKKKLKPSWSSKNFGSKDYLETPGKLFYPSIEPAFISNGGMLSTGMLG